MNLQHHFQNAYVTRNLDAAIAMLKERYGLTEFARFEPEIPTKAGGLLKLRVATTWLDNYQIELIEPVGGAVDFYRDYLPAEDGAIRFHHIASRVDDFEQVRATLDHVVAEGEMPGVRFAYVDARDTVGHYLEYVWCSPEMWKALGGKP
ncbi:MAG: VOC family protein [Kofleriaceae bacterium]